MIIKGAFGTSSILFLLAACLIGCATYKPKPLSPAQTASSIQNRTLDNPGLKEYIQAKLNCPEIPFAPNQWNFNTLTLVAFYYHPDLDLARAKWETARGAIVTAGQRPNPTLEVIPQYTVNPVGQVYEGNRVFDVSVILDPRERRTVSDIGALPLRNSGGTYILLRQLAMIYETSGRYIVLHEGARRVQAITCNVKGRSVGSFVKEAEKQIGSKISFPAGTYVQFAGTAEAQAKSRWDLLVYSLFAGVALVLLLSIVMKNSRNLILVLLNLPFALVGGILAATITSATLSIGSLVGFVTIFGITLRNSMLMLSHYEHLITEEGATWGLETAIRGASERLAPILMTALVTALGMLPLAIASKASGHEIEGPMAIIILGGLITSTLLNLIALPTLALRYSRFEKKEESL